MPWYTLYRISRYAVFCMPRYTVYHLVLQTGPLYAAAYIIPYLAVCSIPNASWCCRQVLHETRQSVTAVLLCNGCLHLQMNLTLSMHCKLFIKLFIVCVL